MSGFPKFPPPPPLTHRPHWAAILTAGAAVLTTPALWGAHGAARHILVIVGLVIVLWAALGFIRDWHMPFVRNRADSPGFVDRKRKRKIQEQVNALVAEQLKIAQRQADAEKMKEKFWESQHGMLIRGGAFRLDFFVWAEPPIYTDSSMLSDFAGSCVVRRGDEEFRS
jgi:hypothetical protein